MNARIVFILFFLFQSAHSFSQFRVKYDDYFQRIEVEGFEVYVDSTNHQTLVIQRNDNKQPRLIALYRRIDADSICSELTYPPVFSNAAYFFFEERKISRFVSDKNDEYFVIIDTKGPESVYRFYRGQEDIFGLVLYVKHQKVTKIVLGNPEQNFQRDGR
ncbi:MAG: hypothetical protein ACFHU9_09615 [Fluviicola sp.]